MSESSLTPKQTTAIVALLGSRTVLEAAVQCGLSERTITRWLGEPVFRNALADAEGALIDGAVRRLLALQTDALDAIADVLLTGTPALRLRAAIAALDMVLKLRELRTIEQRLAALEAATLPQVGER